MPRIYTTTPPLERFWQRVVKTDGCWLYGETSGVYGQLWLNATEYIAAHRFSYELVHGPIPPGFFVCHACDTPAYVNPDHLFLGTPRDNMVDKVRKGRAKGNCQRGGAVRTAVLTEDAVREIRLRYEAGMSMRKIAAQYGVGHAAIRNAIRRITWRHVA